MRGCIVVHGLSGTPACVNPLKEALLGAGFVVSTPCLAGHGKTLSDLDQATWQQWYETVRIAYMELSKSCEKVYYSGISLGALLGLKLAIDEGWGIRALALMATPLILSDFERLAVYVVRYTPLKYFVKSVKRNLEKSVHDPRGRMLYAQSSLPRIPVRSVYQICDLQRVVRKGLKSIASPVLLVHSKNDKVAPPGNVRILKKKISSETVETLMLNESEHVLTMDVEKDLVAKRVVEFFEKFG
jgi:carboxylesterase